MATRIGVNAVKIATINWIFADTGMSLAGAGAFDTIFTCFIAYILFSKFTAASIGDILICCQQNISDRRVLLRALRASVLLIKQYRNMRRPLHVIEVAGTN